MRALERKALSKAAILMGINMSFTSLVPTLATVATFSVHVAVGKSLKASEVSLCDTVCKYVCVCVCGENGWVSLFVFVCVFDVCMYICGFVYVYVCAI